MGKKISNLDEKIFMICYSRPHYQDEIAEIMWGENKKKTTKPKLSPSGGIINQMLKNGDLIQWNLSKEKPVDAFKKKYLLKTNELDEDFAVEITDGRNKGRIYSLSTVKPIIASIEDTISINPDEKRILKEILRSSPFRKSINFAYKKEVRDYSKDIHPISFIIGALAHSAATVFTILHLNPRISRSKLKKNWDLISTNDLRKGANVPNIKFARRLLNISSNELVQNRKLGKIILKADNRLLEKLIELNPRVKNDMIMLAIGKGINPNIFNK